MREIKGNLKDDLLAETLGSLIHNFDMKTEEGQKIYEDYLKYEISIF